jgi:uncharacterized protein YoxC
MKQNPIDIFLTEVNDSAKTVKSDKIDELFEEIDQMLENLEEDLKSDEMEDLEEGTNTRTSTVRMTKGTKRSAVAGRSAVNVCKKKKAGLYRRYQAIREKFMKAKKEIQRSCGKEGMRNARKLIR